MGTMTATGTPGPQDVIIVIYRQSGERVTTAFGPEKSLRLWRARWTRDGRFIARQIDAAGHVREYGAL